MAFPHSSSPASPRLDRALVILAELEQDVLKRLDNRRAVRDGAFRWTNEGMRWIVGEWCLSFDRQLQHQADLCRFYKCGQAAQPLHDEDFDRLLREYLSGISNCPIHDPRTVPVPSRDKPDDQASVSEETFRDSVPAGREHPRNHSPSPDCEERRLSVIDIVRSMRASDPSNPHIPLE